MNDLRVDAGTPLTFEVQAADVDGQIASYLWNFGDAEESGSGVVPSSRTHSWQQPGSYMVTLTVTDDGDPAQSATSVAILVTVEAPLSVNVNAEVDASEPKTLRFSANILGGTETEGAFQEEAGAIYMEAEHFAASDVNSDPNGIQWNVANASPGFRGLGYIPLNTVGV